MREHRSSDRGVARPSAKRRVRARRRRAPPPTVQLDGRPPRLQGLSRRHSVLGMTDPNRRAVVTGLGLVTPLGVGVEETWRAAVEGKSGIGPIVGFDASALPVRFAGEVRDFKAEDWIDAKEARRNDRFIHFALAAAEMAVQDSGLEPAKENGEMIGVVIGSGMGGVKTIEDTTLTLR